MTAPTTAPVTRSSAAILVAMCLGQGLTMFNSTLVSATTPAIGLAMHASSTERQWITASYTLCYAALLLTGGAYGNRIGRRAAFLAGLSAFTVGCLICTVAPDVAALLVGRVVQAAGGAVLLPPTLSILVHEYDDRAARTRAVGIWAGVASLGLSAGPVLGGIIVEFTDWRLGFAFGVAVGLIALGLALVSVPRSRHGRPEDAPPLDAVGAILTVIALGGLAFALIESGNLGWGSPVIVGSFVLFVAGLAAFVGVQARMERVGQRPLMPLHLWRSRAFVAANGAGLVYFISFTGILFFYSADLQIDHGHSPLVAGLSFLPMTLVMAVLGPVAGRLGGRVNPVWVMVSGLTVAGVGCLLLGVLSPHAGLLDLEWRLAVVGAGSGLMSSPMSATAVSSVDTRHSTTAAAVHNTFRQTGSTLAVALLGVLVGPTTRPGFGSGLDHAMLLTAGLLLAWALTVYLIRPRRAAEPLPA